MMKSTVVRNGTWLDRLESEDTPPYSSLLLLRYYENNVYSDSIVITCWTMTLDYTP
jgi:hypothetical protein